MKFRINLNILFDNLENWSMLHQVQGIFLRPPPPPVVPRSVTLLHIYNFHFAHIYLIINNNNFFFFFIFRFVTSSFDSESGKRKLENRGGGERWRARRRRARRRLLRRRRRRWSPWSSRPRRGGRRRFDLDSTPLALPRFSSAPNSRSSPRIFPNFDVIWLN